MEAPRQKLMKDKRYSGGHHDFGGGRGGFTNFRRHRRDQFPYSSLLGAQFYPTMISMGRRARPSRLQPELRQRGFQAWLVGGCVRDLLLGREPKDYDIATDARPDQLLELFPKAQLVGAQFGVVLVDGVEVATFRSDHSYQDGRHPSEVTFESDPKQDVLRRDFTINALLLDPDSLAVSTSPASLKSQVVD